VREAHSATTTSFHIANYTYDANGNTLSDASGKTYTWDFENRLTQAVVPGTGTTSFRYDPFGRRIQKSGPLGTTNYLYDGANSIEDVDQSGNVLARYTRATNIDEPLSEFRSGATSYYEQDGLGSVVSLTNSSGAVAQTYTYDSYGKITAFTGTITNPFQYTAREFDPETNIYYYRSRYYDQTGGRFLGEDPLRFEGGINFYSYVRNDPNDLTDPLGLCPPKSECFAQLKYRYARDGQNHAFWWVQDSDGNRFVIDGGPTWNSGLSHPFGYLNHWTVPGDVGHYPNDNPKASTAYDSGMSAAVCDQVAKLLSAAAGWSDDTIPYDPLGPNSNTFARSVGSAAGFNPQQPPNTVGWNTTIPTPAPTH